MWRENESTESIVAIIPGLSIAIPVGTHFNFATMAMHHS